MNRHEIIIHASESDGMWVQVRCACGEFLLDKRDEASLTEITAAVTLHYTRAAHPELFNGHKKPKLAQP